MAQPRRNQDYDRLCAAARRIGCEVITAAQMDALRIGDKRMIGLVAENERLKKKVARLERGRLWFKIKRRLHVGTQS